LPNSPNLFHHKLLVFFISKLQFTFVNIEFPCEMSQIAEGQKLL